MQPVFGISEQTAVPTLNAGKYGENIQTRHGKAREESLNPKPQNIEADMLLLLF